MRVWTNVKLSAANQDRLRRVVCPAEIVVSRFPSFLVLDSTIPDPELQEVDVAFGQPSVASCLGSKRLKWIHLSTASFARFAAPEVAAALKSSGRALTASGTVFVDPVAQHVLGMMLGGARALPWCAAHQARAGVWNGRFGDRCTSLCEGQVVLIIGCGRIGLRLAEFLAPFRCRIQGFRRSPLESGIIEMISAANLAEALAKADHVVNTLPEAPSTRRWFSRGIFSQMKPKARFYSVGRGSTVDQGALRAALASGSLGMAYLDVTDPEPLPPEDPLWKQENCFITPHIGGSQPELGDRLLDCFEKQWHRYTVGEALDGRIV